MILFSVLWIAGFRPNPANPANPIRTVAVLPMVNQTNDVEAPEKVRAKFADRMTKKQYAVKPIAEVNRILKDELGITLGSQLDMTNPQELGQKLGVDDIIYGTLFDFNEKTTGVLNIRRARAGFKLVDAKTGAVVWGKGQGVRSETRMAKGNTRAVAGAASEISKAQDISEGKEIKDVGGYIGVQNWHNLPPEESLSEQIGQEGIFAAFVSGLAEKAIKKATGTFLERESEIMIDMIIKTLPLEEDRRNLENEKLEVASLPPPPPSEIKTPPLVKGDEGGFNIVMIPAGEFMAGEPDSLKGMVLSAFYIDKYEVTQREYEQVMGNNPSEFKGCDNCPVEQVTWFEAKEYCEKVGKRLPTEWEWEKAAKAGTTTTFYWGESKSMANDYAWYDKNSEDTHPVGKKKPNKYGLYDMAGNVWEWTSSDYDGSRKVLRGGSWDDTPDLLWSSDRLRGGPSSRLRYNGFHCAGASGQ